MTYEVEKFIEVRKLTGLTKKCLADKLEISEQTVRNFERGRSSISIATYNKAMQIMGFKLLIVK